MVFNWPIFSLMFLIQVFLYAGVYCTKHIPNTIFCKYYTYYVLCKLLCTLCSINHVVPFFINHCGKFELKLTAAR